MSSFPFTSALVTGANSGLGFESAARLAESGVDRVVLACRSLEKAEAARQKLVARTGRDPFETLAVDVGSQPMIQAALRTLTERGGPFGYLLLNAGLAAGSEISRTDDDIEITVAASLVGHHALTLGLLDADLLESDARVVIAGSEAARGDVPMMGLTDVPAFANKHHGGDRTQAIVTIARAHAPYRYSQMPQYAMAKVFVAWWAAALSRRLPSGMTVNAVSPGSAPDTGAMRNQHWIMRYIMMPIIKVLGPIFGMAATLRTATDRYLDAASYGPEINGDFFASKPGKMIGKVEVMTHDHLRDRENQEALWDAVVELSGVGDRVVQPAPLAIAS